MTDQDDNEYKLEGHTYDGIEELDNRLPQWWLGTLYVTMVFAAGYWVWFLGPGASQDKEFAQERAQWELVQLQQAKGDQPLSEAQLVNFVKNPSMTGKGQAVFTAKCAACHGAQLQGLIGPNLVDAYWLHGGKMTDIVKTVTAGVPDKGMPPWGPLLSKDEIHAVSAFIKSKKGTQVAGAKAPQGELEKE